MYFLEWLGKVKDHKSIFTQSDHYSKSKNNIQFKIGIQKSSCLSKKKFGIKKLIFILEFRKVVRLKLEKGKKVSCLKVIPLNSFFFRSKISIELKYEPAAAYDKKKRYNKKLRDLKNWESVQGLYTYENVVRTSKDKIMCRSFKRLRI